MTRLASLIKSKQDWQIEEAFAYFCGEEVNTEPAQLIGQPAYDLIVQAAKRSRFKFQVAATLVISAVGFAGARIVGLNSSWLGTVSTIAVVIGAFGFAGNLYARPHEPSHKDLLRCALTPQQVTCIEAMKEFRRLLAEGTIIALPSISSRFKGPIEPRLFDADNGRVMIIGADYRESIRPFLRKPVGPIRVSWTPQRYAPAKSKLDCVDVLENVSQLEFEKWRDALINCAKGNTQGRLRNLLDAMYAVATNKSRNRDANVIDQVITQLNSKSPSFKRETIDKILHGTVTPSGYEYVLRYLKACKNGQTVAIEMATRGHPKVTFTAP